MKHSIDNYINSGWKFSDDQLLLKRRINLVNIILALGLMGLIQGVIANSLNHYFILVTMEIILFVYFSFTIFLIRKSLQHYDFVSRSISVLTLILFNALILFSQIENIKFIWLFFYVVVFLFLRGNKEGLMWVGLLFVSLIITKLQPFYPNYLNVDQLLYLLFVLSMVTLVILFFQMVIDRSFDTILKQGEKLKIFNHDLEVQVALKTKELVEINETLEKRVDEKVTKLKEQQEMMISQSRHAAMGEMLSMIAHQWRQPLATTTLRISEMNIRSLLAHKQLDDRDALLAEVSETLLYLSDTINDFQTYFKPQKERINVSVKKLIMQSQEFAKSRITLYDINFLCDCDESYEVEIYSNELIQVLLNIFNNAIDAMTEDKVKEKRIEVKITVEAERLLINISNSGNSIKPKIAKKIFEPYFSTKDKNGTGLGLYMAKVIIEEHMGGQITIDKAYTEGVRFLIELPYKNSYNGTT